MYIHLGYVRGQIRLRNPEITNNNDNLGSMLKHHRLKLNLTLEEGAEGICSISYLSKIENSLIKPSERYLSLLEEKYNTSFYAVETSQDQLLYQLIENIFYKDIEFMDDTMFLEDNYQSKLNELGYLITQNQYDDAKNKHQALNPYIKNLNNLELASYIFFTSKILSHEGRIKDAFSMLHIDCGYIKNLFLKTLICVERFMLATKMNQHPYITMHYDNLLNDLIENEFYHLLHEVKFYYLKYLVQFINEAQLEKLLQKAKHLEQHQHTYLQARFYYANMQYDKAYELLKNQAHHDESNYELVLMILNKLNMSKEIQQILGTKYVLANKHAGRIRDYLKVKYQPKMDISLLASYIHDEILKTNDLPDDIRQLNFWYEEGHQTFKKIGYYKDATTLGHLIFRKTKDLCTIFD